MALKRPEIEITEAVNGEWFWHLQSANGEILAKGEGHRDRHDAKRAAKTARRTMAVAKITSE
jgi:uncharacterized protein YegP (UPF0339 family)